MTITTKFNLGDRVLVKDPGTYSAEILRIHFYADIDGTATTIYFLCGYSGFFTEEQLEAVE